MFALPKITEGRNKGEGLIREIPKHCKPDDQWPLIRKSGVSDSGTIAKQHYNKSLFAAILFCPVDELVAFPDKPRSLNHKVRQPMAVGLAGFKVFVHQRSEVACLRRHGQLIHVDLM